MEDDFNHEVKYIKMDKNASNFECTSNVAYSSAFNASKAAVGLLVDWRISFLLSYFILVGYEYK